MGIEVANFWPRFAYLPATIAGWGTAVPDGRLTNADLEARVDTTDEWIRERTGIRERRVAGPDETTASLATASRMSMPSTASW